MSEHEWKSIYNSGQKSYLKYAWFYYLSAMNTEQVQKGENGLKYIWGLIMIESVHFLKQKHKKINTMSQIKMTDVYFIGTTKKSLKTAKW